MSVYNCGVLNCGDGSCTHKLTDECCPCCGEKMVEVITTGYKFCSNNPAVCDYEIKGKNISTNPAIERAEVIEVLEGEIAGYIESFTHRIGEHKGKVVDVLHIIRCFEAAIDILREET